MLKIKKLAISLLPLISLVMPFNASYSAVKPAVVSSPGLELLKRAKLLEPTNLAQEIHFTVHLNVRNRKQFDALYQEIYSINSPRYHHYLTTAEYDAEFAPTPKTIDLVKQYFTDHGMTAKGVAGKIQVKATVAQIQETFKVKINNYRYQNKSVYSNDTELKVAPTIAPYILGITGLNNIPRFHKMVLSAPRKKQAQINPQMRKANQQALANLAWNSFTPKVLPSDTSLNGFTGAQLRTTYNLAAIPSINGTTLDGTGQTIVILDEWGINDPATIMADANKFSALNQLPLLSFTSSPGQAANFAVVRADGTPYAPNHHDTDQGWADEIALDLASAHTIAPKANIVLVLDNSLDLSTIISTIIGSSNVSFGGFANAYVLSNSWGEDEVLDTVLETHLQLAAMNGISVNFSSADCGDGSYHSSWPCHASSSAPIVQYPASSTNATAVGGSSLFVDSNYNYSFESGWGSAYPSSGFYAGSTGGISQLYSAPAWQNNSTFQGFTAGGYGIIGSYGGMRAVPDIAMLADIHTGIIAYYTNGCDNGCIFGGTSVACPLYSATLTLINEARMLQSKSTMGLSAQYLYAFDQVLLQNQGINFITPPHRIIDSTVPNPPNAPNYAFTLFDQSYWFHRKVTFNWDSSLTMNENQYWNDVVGLGSPNLPIFVPFMASL
ncbi:MAG: S53 family peptidase [Legionella sp.]|uniref:S53 family peptidase n=1 Tax=Legionella sp. TaxID=459 RepID=UPI00284F491D|nr:S53 family peptidase [Legionella sp.]